MPGLKVMGKPHAVSTSIALVSNELNESHGFSARAAMPTLTSRRSGLSEEFLRAVPQQKQRWLGYIKACIIDINMCAYAQTCCVRLVDLNVASAQIIMDCTGRDATRGETLRR